MPPLAARDVPCFLRDKVSLLTVAPSQNPLERRNLCDSIDEECSRPQVEPFRLLGTEPVRDSWFH